MNVLLLIGVNHKNADVALRERVSFNREQTRAVLAEVIRFPFVDESVLLSTCNRTEFLLRVSNAPYAESRILQFLAQKAEMDQSVIAASVYKKTNYEAVAHIFKVAGGLESMVLGEPQIAGQVKDAFDLAVEEGTAGSCLVDLYNYTQQTAKRVRSETEISKNAVSVSYAAVELARKVFDTLSGKRALLIGAGEMCRLAAGHFHDHGVMAVDVVNRTLAKAQELARRFAGQGLPFDDLCPAMENADIVLASTGATEPVVLASSVREIMKKRGHRPLFFIDIGVPRNIDEKVGEIADVYLFNIDDLKQVVEANRKKRGEEAIRALAIVEEQVAEYRKCCQLRGVNPLITGLRSRAEAIRRAEMERAHKKLKDYPEEVHRELERMSAALMNKVLHQPISGFKREVGESNSANKIVAFFKSIFNLGGSGENCDSECVHRYQGLCIGYVADPTSEVHAGEGISGNKL